MQSDCSPPQVSNGKSSGQPGRMLKQGAAAAVLVAAALPLTGFHKGEAMQPLDISSALSHEALLQPLAGEEVLVSGTLTHCRTSKNYPLHPLPIGSTEYGYLLTNGEGSSIEIVSSQWLAESPAPVEFIGVLQFAANGEPRLVSPQAL